MYCLYTEAMVVIIFCFYSLKHSAACIAIDLAYECSSVEGQYY